MKVSFIENTPSVVRFKVSDAGSTVVNSLRRIATNGVSTFAIDSVTFYENTTAMFDEYISHRLGLIPLMTPESGYDEKDEILFHLEAEGPKTVYSRDLEGTDKKVKVANENIPIIKLLEGQSIKLDGKARLGNSMKNSKFMPGLVTFKSNDQESEFEFYIESFGQMTAKEILNRALDIIDDGLKATQKEVKK
ncbi:MAG: DNA-directed RNA polymerase subunit D [Candidatus Micrarchaeota archaeon]|nr:DNA-directed RNA polymerase subunit D [Candidatus Micrarchaeota archaeon]MDE1804370.1 DNA-directed RNA polymerase subunit D [Candidatus Micrarchaeota archaeon]MDE1846614.1 DNA-directed RNA polymerase subunit D [Candidatus Micrarchaeota archaeon]